MAIVQQHDEIDGVYDVGVIGVGHIALHYHLPILEFLEATTIAFVADIDSTETTRAAKAFETVGHPIEDIGAIPECDVVLLATPVTVRKPYIREFGNRKTPIFTEKPFAIDVDTHREFLQHTTDIGCNYTRLEFGTSHQMKRVFEEELFGKPLGVMISKGMAQRSTGKTKSQVDPDTRGGQLHEDGSHLLSQLLYLLAEYDVEAEQADIRWHRGLDVHIEAELQANLDERRIPISFELSLIRERPSKITVEFETATVSFDPADPTASLLVSSSFAPEETAVGLQRPGQAPVNHEQAILDRWVSYLSALEAQTIDAASETGLGVSRIITDIYEQEGVWPGEAG